MPIVSIVNLKGGVGKSTITMILGEYLAYDLRYKVLLVDLDAQANLTTCMLRSGDAGEMEKQRRSVYHLFKAVLDGSVIFLDTEQFVVRPPYQVSNIARGAVREGTDKNLDLVASTPSVAQLDEDMLDAWQNKSLSPEQLRKQLIEALLKLRGGYDYVLIDCPPGLSLFSSTVFAVSNYFVCPIIPEPLSIKGVDLLLDRAGRWSDSGKRCNFAGTILNLVKPYRNTHRKVAEHVYSDSKYFAFHWWIPESERLRKLGDFEPPEEYKELFHGLTDKYRGSNKLTNPREDSLAYCLSRTKEEGDSYWLDERLRRLAHEFVARCPCERGEL